MLEQHSPPLQLAPPVEEPAAGPAKGSSRPTRRRWVWGLLLILLLAAGAYTLWPKITGVNGNAPPSKGGGKGGNTPAAVPVVATKTRKGDIGVYLTGLGAITPLATVTVRSRVDGQLTSVRYREGDTVHKGDLLVEIDDGPYQAALTQAEGQLLKDQAALENARLDLARYQTLVPLKAIPEQQLATQQATVHQDEGAIKIDQGQVESARVNLAYTKITAPITGRIGLRLVDVGNIVHAGDTTGLVVITQMDPISAIFTISEDQLPPVIQKMAAGQTLEVDAYDREAQTKVAQGTLTTLDNQIDQTTGTVKLRATFENSKGTLFPNQFVNARLLVQEKHGVTLIPNAAVQRNSQAIYAYVVKPDSTVTVRQITLGTTEGDNSEVTSGLMPGEIVVMTGVDKLQEGSKVTYQIDGANPSAVKPAVASSTTDGGKFQKGK
jgi:multidrug efflux system membrane fusion protein